MIIHSCFSREPLSPIPKNHEQSPGGVYARSNNIKRFEVTEDQISWKINFPEYAPPEFTGDKVLEGPEWADPDVSECHKNAKPPLTKSLKFNAIDGKVNRKSHMGRYHIDKNGIPW